MNTSEIDYRPDLLENSTDEELTEPRFPAWCTHPKPVWRPPFKGIGAPRPSMLTVTVCETLAVWPVESVTVKVTTYVPVSRYEWLVEVSPHWREVLLDELFQRDV